MNDFLDPRQCRDLIAELAEMLPRVFGRQELAAWPSPFDEPDEMRRRRRDPVFTGGAVVGLLITDPAAPPPSRTKDIDVVLEIAGYGEFAAMEQSLRQAGFTQNWLDNAPVVAWYWRGIRVDFLPHKPMEMMKTNRWFPYLIDEAERIEVAREKFAWCASAPCFIATKLEAFFSRGKGDYLTSKDMEDTLAVIDGREELVDDIRITAPEVSGFIAASFRELMGSERFMECIPRIVPEDAREEIVLQRLRKITAHR